MGCVHLPKPGNQPFFPVENRRRSRRKQRRNPEFGQQGVPVILSQSLPEWGFSAPRGILAAVLPQAHTVDTGEHIFFINSFVFFHPSKKAGPLRALPFLQHKKEPLSQGTEVL